MHKILRLYQAKLERFAIANYYECRENEKLGIPKYRQVHYKNEAIEEGLNAMIKVARELISED